MELHVAEDPVTGVWRFQLHGHQVEVEARLGFVKVDGQVHRVAAVEGLHKVEDLAGTPLTAILRLLGEPTSDEQTEPSASAPIRVPEAPEARQPQTRPRKRRRPPRAKQPKPEAKPTKAQQSPTNKGGALPTPAAARYVGLSKATLESLRTRGGGPPFVKLGRRVVYRRDDLDAWLEERKRTSTSDPGRNSPRQG